VAFDVDQVRACYPALQGARRFRVYLDGAAGTQSPQGVIDAVADAYRDGMSNAGGDFVTSRRASEVTASARGAVADLVNGTPEGVVLGPNMTTLTYRFAQALSQQWGPGDNIVLSQLDHDANVRPWEQWAHRVGADVRWARIDATTGELPVGQYRDLVDERTRLVAVTAASNVLGTRPQVRAIIDIVHAAGALVYVDGVHSTAHGVTDIAALGSDFYATSAYKWDGPHVGCVIADPQLLAQLRPDKLLPSSNEVPDRFEWGTPCFHNFAGVAAAVDHLARLDPETSGGRRHRLVASLRAAEAHERALFARLFGGLDADPRVTTYGGAAERTATAYFTVAGHSPEVVARHFAEHDVFVWSGHNYAWEVTGALGIRDSGSAVRASLSHYSNDADVDRFLTVLADL